MKMPHTHTQMCGSFPYSTYKSNLPFYNMNKKQLFNEIVQQIISAEHEVLKRNTLEELKEALEELKVILNDLRSK